MHNLNHKGWFGVDTRGSLAISDLESLNANNQWVPGSYHLGLRICAIRLVSDSDRLP
jgi:hypothetical protein